MYYLLFLYKKEFYNDNVKNLHYYLITIYHVCKISLLIFIITITLKSITNWLKLLVADH